MPTHAHRAPIPKWAPVEIGSAEESFPNSYCESARVKNTSEHEPCQDGPENEPLMHYAHYNRAAFVWDILGCHAAVE